MSKLYKRPIVSTVFECIGAAAFIAGVFAFITAYVDASHGHPGAPGAIAGAVFIIMAAVFVGIGQVVDFLGRASHRADLVGSLLVEEILPQLKAMEPRPAPTPAVVPASSSGVTPQPQNPEYFYSKSGKEEGPFSATELQTLRARGVIKDNTPIFRTGEKEWLPLRQFPDLAKSA